MKKTFKPWIAAGLVIIFLVGLVLWLIKSDKLSKIIVKDYGKQIEFEIGNTKEIKFKSLVGADVRVSVASEDTVVPVAVTQDGQDTLIRLRPIAKKVLK